MKSVRVLAVTCGLVVLSLVFAEKGHDATIHTSMSVRVTILSQLECRVITDQSVLSLSASDLNKGYKKIKGGTVLRFTTSSLGGFFLALNCQAVQYLSSVQVTVVETRRTYTLTPGGSTEFYVPFNGATSVTLTMDYNFILSPSAQSIQYPWPIGRMYRF